MALTAFVPNIWSARFLDRLNKKLVWGNLINRNYEGEIASAGNVVKIPSATTDVAVTDYVDGTNLTSPQRVTGSTQDLSIDQQKYFNFKVSDLERVQNKPELIDVHMDLAAAAIGKVVDTYLMGIFDGGVASARTATEATASGALATKGLIFKAFSKLKKLMTKADIPESGRWCVVSPEFVEGLESYLVAQTSASDLFVPVTSESTLRNGFIGRLMGFDTYVSNAVPTTGSGNSKKQRLVASWDRASVTHADQITEIEGLRDQDDFADKIRGLYVYGAKLVHPTRIFCVEIDDV